MKLIGLIGGTSWVSTIEYYRLINLGINKKLGGINYAHCIIYSFNFADIKMNNDNNDWDKNLKLVITASEHLKRAGAEAIILCANTMHLIADRLEQEIKLPVIHIATVTTNEITKRGLHRVGLLGTKFTMELDFFKRKLAEQNIEIIIPCEEDRNFIHHSIFEELGKNILKSETKEKYIAIINRLNEQGAEGIILGCTEIPLLIRQEDINIPVFDTTQIHAAAAVDFSTG